MPRLQKFEVVGIFEVGLQEHDSVLALMNLEDAEALRGLAARPEFASVSRRAEGAASSRAPRWRGSPADIRCATGHRRTRRTFAPIRIEKTMMGLILMLIVAVAAFNIVATLVMVVSDKRTDIAILRTLGMTPARNSRGVHDARSAHRLDRHGNRRDRWASRSRSMSMWWCRSSRACSDVHIMDDPDVYYIAGLPSETHAADVIRIAVAAMVLTLLATIYPALQAAKTQPAEALRYE